MTAPESNSAGRPSPSFAVPLLGVSLILSGVILFLLMGARSDRQQHAQQLGQIQQNLDELAAEVTRMRIEQAAEGKGAHALLEKMRVYASLAASSRTTEPDFQNAKKELLSIMRAFDSLGEKAWLPVVGRLQEVDAQKDFDEIKWLLEAALRVDEEPAKQIVKEILLGLRLPYPRLRWWAATLLTERDKPLARILLRQILETESSRGVNPERIGSYPGMVIPDLAAVATTGFNNFVEHYIRTEDPKTEETLLMLLGRIEHDSITIQACIKELGRRKCERAVKPIKRLYEKPPLQQQNPLFLIICVRGVYDIQGADAKQWLEEVVTNAPTQEVADVARDLLAEIN